jgi:hypothetical protein
VAAQVLPGDKLDEFKELLKNKSTPNGGVAVTDDLKYNSMSLMQLKSYQLFTACTVKFSRQNGIHVSPTVVWDGVIAAQISSSWGEKEWNEFLASNV